MGELTVEQRLEKLAGMDDCIVRKCSKCNHKTVHQIQTKTLEGVCFSVSSQISGEPQEEYNERLKPYYDEMGRRRVESTIKEYKCLNCGKTWVDVESVDFIGDYRYKVRDYTYEDVSNYNNIITLEGYNRE